MTGIHTANKDGDIVSYIKDHHGNIVGRADYMGEMIEEQNNRMDYDAYGNQWIGDAPEPFGYCGEYYDKETDNIYLRARYYSPVQGRFTTEDPAEDGLNWYSYCSNNPIMYVDLLGLGQENILDEDTNVIDVRYDLRVLVDVVKGVLKVEDNIVYIQAMGKLVTIDLAEVAMKDETLSQYEKHNIGGSLHYTMKEFLSMFDVDYTIETVQIQVTESEARFSRFKQIGAKGIAKLLDVSVSVICDEIDGYIGAVNSIRSAMGIEWNPQFDPILEPGFYKKQYIEINLPTGKGIICNYVVPYHSFGDNGIIIREHWNADMSTLPYGGGYDYPL